MKIKSFVFCNIEEENKVRQPRIEGLMTSQNGAELA